MIIEYKNTPVFYTDNGKGHTIVLLHGFLENSSMWDTMVPKLSEKHRVVCIDLLGHGKTGCLGYIHTMELMAEAVQAVLNHLKIEAATFVGHSMGGYVALAFAEVNPKTVSGFCLINSTALADSQEKQQNRDRAIIAVKQNHRTFIRLSILNLFRPKNRLVFSKRIIEIINQALETPLQGIIAALEGMKIRKNRLSLLHDTAFKKMMVIGKKDPVLNYDSIMEQTKNTDIKIVEFPDGHMSHVENEDDLLYEVMHFIEN